MDVKLVDQNHKDVRESVPTQPSSFSPVTFPPRGTRPPRQLRGMSSTPPQQSRPKALIPANAFFFFNLE